MKKISFDFDNTLSRVDIQNFAKELVNKGYEVWIVTSRTDTELSLSRGWNWVKNQNDVLYKVAESCGILRESIHFTDHVDKIEFLQGKNFLFHIDDDPDELWEIVKSGDTCKVVNANHSDWLIHCSDILSNY